MSEWIKVDDEFPPLTGMVIFYDGHNVWPGWVDVDPWGEIDPYKDIKACCVDPDFMYRAKPPIYWMRMPQSPDKEWLDKAKMEWTKNE